MNWWGEKKAVIPERIEVKKERKRSRSNEWIDEKRKEVIPKRVVEKKKRKGSTSNEWIDEKRKKR